MEKLRNKYYSAVALSLMAFSSAAKAGEMPQPAPMHNVPVAGTSSEATPAGWLVIDGGGDNPEIRPHFLKLAGGHDARLVIIPTASAKANDADAEERYLEPWRRLGANNVDMLHTLDRTKAEEEDFSKILDEATGVWFSGGDQWTLIKTYKKTPVERRLHGVLARNKVVGGTSAGAAVMGRRSIVRGKYTAVLDDGFGFLDDNCMVDQHADARERLKRLLDGMEQSNCKIGLGVYEGSALVVHRKSAQATVMGKPSLVTKAGVAREYMPGETFNVNMFIAPTTPVSTEAATGGMED